MSSVTPPPHEASRLAALQRYAILDTPAEAEFDDFTRLAARICGTPIALISFVDDNRQWFKSNIGLATGETSRDIAFCSHAIAGNTLFEVPDTTRDKRFSGNPLVTGDPNVRFYAGEPLTTPDGYNLGTLCVMDRVPRRLTPEQREALGQLGRQVVTRLELRSANRRLSEQAGNQLTILRSASSAIVATDLDGLATLFNPSAEELLGYSANEVVGRLTPTAFHDPAELAARAAELSGELDREISPGLDVFRAATERGRVDTREWFYVRKNGERVPVLLSLSALRDPEGKVTGFLSVARDLTRPKTIEAERDRLLTLALRQREMLAEVREVQNQFIAHEDPSEAFERLLSVLLRFTESEYGFIGEVLRATNGSPYLKTHAITNIAWNDDTRKFYEDHAPTGMEFFNLNTLFGSVMTSAQPVIANTPASDPRRGGLPPGHPAMKAFLGVPIKVGDQLVGMVGVANRSSGYSEADVEELEPLLGTYGNLIIARRHRLERHAAESALREMNARLEGLVTERAAELAERERFLRALLGNLDGMAYRCSSERHGTMEFVSDGVQNLLGIPPETLTTGQATCSSLVHPEDLERVWAKRQESLAARRPCQLEYRLRHADGDWRWVWDQSHGVYDGNGRAIAIEGYIVDVTERRAAASKVTRAERQFRDLFEFSPDAIVMTDSSGTISLVNREAQHLFGFTHNELVGESLEILIGDSLRYLRFPDGNLTVASRTPSTTHTNLQGRKKDGRLFPAEITVSPIESPDGRVAVVSVRDTTDRLKAEQQMRQALATLDAGTDGAFIFDAQSLRFSYVNEGAVWQLGYTREELLTLTPLDIKPLFTELEFRALLAEVTARKDGGHQVTTLHRRKDGRDVPVEISLKHVAPPGERPRFIAVVRDITERLQQERLAHRAQRMESIGALAVGIAHDLNNTLAPIMMSVELLRMQYPERPELLDAIQVSTQRGADMVRQLLTFGKGTEGERAPVNVGRLILELQGLIKGTFPKSIQWVARIAQDLPFVIGDVTQLHQVMLNLCVNARDAMPHGGTLTIVAACRNVDAAYASTVPDAAPGRYVALEVRDTGSGIEPDVIERVFDPFFSTKGRDQGTGLGLSTVLGIVRAHGGFVQVESKVGQGTTFTVHVPADQPVGAANELTPGVGTGFRGRQETILFVDDEAAVRQAALQVLSRLNFTPLIADDGADALVKAAQHRTEVRAIITDLHMPHMDGLTFVRTVRRILPDIPITVASGAIEDAVAREVEELGVANRLNKPFSEMQLLKALEGMLHAR